MRAGITRRLRVERVRPVLPGKPSGWGCGGLCGWMARSVGLGAGARVAAWICLYRASTGIRCERSRRSRHWTGKTRSRNFMSGLFPDIRTAVRTAWFRFGPSPGPCPRPCPWRCSQRLTTENTKDHGDPRRRCGAAIVPTGHTGAYAGRSASPRGDLNDPSPTPAANPMPPTRPPRLRGSPWSFVFSVVNPCGRSNRPGRGFGAQTAMPNPAMGPRPCIRMRTVRHPSRAGSLHWRRTGFRMSTFENRPCHTIRLPAHVARLPDSGSGGGLERGKLRVSGIDLGHWLSLCSWS